MSISNKDNNLKILNINNWECILDLTNINKDGYLNSACFLEQNKEIYILTSNANKNGTSEAIKVFNLNKQKTKEINNSNGFVLFIDSYYDKILSQYYIITGNINFSQSYDYDINNKYHKYNDNDKYIIYNIIVKNIKGKIKLIESCSDGIIRIFSFHLGLLLNKINVSNHDLYEACFWNESYLFVGCEDKTIKQIEINNGIVVNNISGHNKGVLTVKKIIHPKYGECLISQNLGKSEIKLWINELK